MRLNLYASLGHYAEHLWPIWEQLPAEHRGAAWSACDGSWWGRPVAGSADLDANPGPVLVASHGDAASATTRGRPLVYVEHGAGQTYGGDQNGAGAPGLSGSTDPTMRRVLLFVCPSDTVASRWRQLYDVPAVAVGCPKLDDWHITGGAKSDGLMPTTVAVTFHWDCSLVPETMTAWPEYDHVLPALATWCHDHDVLLLGHGHPRIWPRIARRWAALGIASTAHLSDVLDHADVLVADNTSAMYEFASLGRPVIAVNAAGYRRHIEHGLRFWSHVPGVQVDDPAELVATVAAQLADPTMGIGLRTAATAAAYAHSDGLAAQRAAHAIIEVLTHDRTGPT